MNRTVSTSRHVLLQVGCLLLLLTNSGSTFQPFKQLTRTTGHRERTDAYIKCSHPFHAWMCQVPSLHRPSSVTTTIAISFRKKLSTPAPSDTHSPGSIPTTTPQLRQESTIFSNPTTTLTPPIPPSASDTSPRIKSLKSFKSQQQTLQQETYYDQCSHPFHAWLCNYTTRPRTSQRPTQRTTRRLTQHSNPRSTRRPIPRPARRPTLHPSFHPTNGPALASIPEASNSKKVSLPSSHSSITPWHYHICSHPFHIWWCERPRRVPKPSNLRKSVKPATPKPSSSPKIRTEPTLARPPEAKPEPSWEGSDPCTHAFHAWLCNRSVPRLRARPTRKPSVEPTSIPAASFPLLVSALSTNNLPTTPTPFTATPLVTTSKGRRESVVKSENVSDPQPEPESSLKDICNHPFHSFLCSSIPRTTTTAAPPLTAKEPNPVSSLLPQTKAKPYPHRGNICDHLFHAWVCDRRSDKQKKYQRREQARLSVRRKEVNGVSEPVDDTPSGTTFPRPVSSQPHSKAELQFDLSIQ